MKISLQSCLRKMVMLLSPRISMKMGAILILILSYLRFRTTLCWMLSAISIQGMQSSPEICIQAKKKEGTDADDLHGVKQLILMKDKEEYQNSIFIVINSEKEFSNDAKEKAGKANIILLNGYQFANLLVRYDVELGL